jgi:hypothetical protein
MKKFELTPTNGRQSFNRKCIVEEDNGISTLISYNTNVATYNHENNHMIVLGYYSATTLTHINAFLDYYGFDICTKKELIETYNLKETNKKRNK